MKRRDFAGRSAWIALIVVLLIWSARGADVDPAALFGADGRAAVLRFLGGLFPPEASWAYVGGLVQPAVETLQMAFLGVVFGALIAAPISAFAARLPGSRSSSAVTVAYAIARGVLNVMRTIPDLVWALLFIAAVGLGSFAGVLALTIHSAGLLGKLYSEALETVDQAPGETMRATGAGGAAVLTWAVLPQAMPALASATLYQWECNIRAAMVLGFVGAGGLGQRIDIAMRLFRYEEMLPLLAVLLLLVTLVDRLSALISGRLARRAV